jgi:hypothetical protein
MNDEIDGDEGFGEVEIDLDDSTEDDANLGDVLDEMLPSVGGVPDVHAGRGLPGFFDPEVGPDDDTPEEARSWPIVLFSGHEVTGPFHRPALDGSPMIEVCPIVRNAKGKKIRGAWQVRVPHDFDEGQLADEVGEGEWYLVVRGPAGNILAATSIRIGQPRAAVRGVHRRRTEDGGARSGAVGRPAAQPAAGNRLDRALGALLENQKRQDDLLSKLLREKVDREEQDAREARERDRQRLEDLAERVEKAVKGRGGERGGDRGGPFDPIDAFRRHLEERRKFDEMLAELGVGSAPTEVGEEEGDVMETALGMVERWGKVARSVMTGDDDE